MRAEEIINRRKDRAIAIIMKTIEKEVYPLLEQVSSGEQAKRALRKVVMDQVNDFADLAKDVAGSGEASGFEFNEAALDRKLDGVVKRVVEAVS